MREVIERNLRARFAAYADLIATVDEAMLTAKLDVPKHKSLNEHLWCVVGARESYARALAAGQWEGFRCSMGAYSCDDFCNKLNDSAESVMKAIASVTEWTPQREQLLAMLSEHEVMHEGQIIRHVYGTGGVLPKSWVWA